MRFTGTIGEQGPDPVQLAGTPPDERIWSAVLLAGTRSERDPLAAQFQVGMKALVPVAGAPMIGHVVRTLAASPSIGRILILAQDLELLRGGDLSWIADMPQVELCVSGSGIADSLVQVVGTAAAPYPVLVTTADHPLLTVDMIEYFIRKSAHSDISLGVVDRQLLSRSYPKSRRTWLHFADGDYTGANLFSVRTDRAADGLRVLAKAETHRKSQLRLLRHFGPGLALGALTRTLSLHEVVDRGGGRFGLKAATVVMPFAEAGIDVDRPDDHELAERILSERPASLTRRGEPVQVSVFDLDRTVTRRGTYTAFLLQCARARSPWRLALAPAAAFHFFLHALGGSSRKRLKERLQSLFLGARIEREEIGRLARLFTAGLRSNGFYEGALRRIKEEKKQGRRIVLATAANAFYVDEIARELGIEEIVCTRSVWDGDHLTPRIDGENCHGGEKLAMLEAHFGRSGLDRGSLHIRFFSDHRSDGPVLRWADEAVVINPGRSLRGYATAAGWPVLTWS
ncbi:MAG TPA: HAD-IB family phosphatase [Allosphingosinicella sp.]|nr:HAD-IB family phosphatase [Allosphingosinicella sp.]